MNNKPYLCNSFQKHRAMNIKTIIYTTIISIVILTIAPACKTQSHAKKSQRKALKRYGAPRDCGCH